MKVFKVVLKLVVAWSFIATMPTAAAAAASAQAVSGGGVTVKVAYLNPGRRTEPRFQVTLDTHSVNLDAYDLKTLAVLRDDRGKSYAPVAAENRGGGHHREVTLTFPELSAETKRVEIAIKNIAGVEERKFSWNLD
ncbi:MAG TPA: hypothetical protein VNN77_05310 [candidate division Zixibacteria bacterium]|nr:hypothetical protein [candidate division Zixibacteria bacterium]